MNLAKAPGSLEDLYTVVDVFLEAIQEVKAAQS
jgi:hypothetical protein